MFSAFKRLAGKADGTGHGASRPAHQSMPTILQKKFAKGVQYNMKIIIKGDRNVGKTCLFHRLQGQKFIEEYVPTEEIQVASIQWNYKATDDIVKVEVWDVVDRGRRRKKLEGLKMDNAPLENVIEEPTLDAEFLDVYKGTNGVIIMLDITKTWTFDYVQRELPKIPSHIPVIVLGNHCDMSHHRTVSSDHVTYFIESLRERAAQVRYAESSMRNGFGLKLLHKFFNLPFLQLQRETLLKQLDTNEKETCLTVQELDLYQESDDANYNKFLDNLINKRRAIAESISASNQTVYVTTATNNHLSCSNASSNIHTKKTISTSVPLGGGNPIPVNQLELKSQPKKENTVKSSSENSTGFIRSTCAGMVSSTIQNTSSMELINTMDVIADLEERRNSGNLKQQSFMSIIFGNRKGEEVERLSSINNTDTNAPLTSVEDFVPDDGLIDRSFLEDNNQNSPQQVQNEHLDSESDMETGNPLVAGYEDDLSSVDEVVPSLQPKLIENPLSRQKYKQETLSSTSVDTKDSMNALKRNSVSSIEHEIHISRSLLENGEDSIGLDSLDTWLQQDSKWRQSPEGGEDISNNNAKKDRFELSDKSLDVSVTSSNVHLELLDNGSIRHISSSASSPIMKEKKKHKEKVEDKEKKKKKKSKEKEKEKEKCEKVEKKKRRSLHRSKDEDREQDELEEFLNGSTTRINIDVAYEAI